MNIGTSTLRPGSFDQHLIARKHAKKKSKRVLLASLALTSMVDMFSLLVIFLLQTFSTSPEMLFTMKGVELPLAGSGVEIVDAPVLALTETELFLDQKLVGPIDQVMKNPEPLMEKLEGLRETWQQSHPTEKFKGEINIQAHKKTPSTVVSQVMGLLPAQQYGSIQLVVTTGN